MRLVDLHGRSSIALLGRLLHENDPNWKFTDREIQDKLHTIDRAKAKKKEPKAEPKGPSLPSSPLPFPLPIPLFH